MKLSDSIRTLTGIGSKLEELFESIDVISVKDLLLTFPRNYLDYSERVDIANLSEDTPKTFIGRVEKFSNVRIRGGKSLQKATLVDQKPSNSSKIEAVWFNMSFLEFNPGDEYLFVAKLSKNNKTGKPQLNSPVFEKLDGEHIHTDRIVPVYKLTKGLSPKVYRKLINKILKQIDSTADFPNATDNHIRELKQENSETELLLDTKAAIKEIHFPSSLKELEKAKFRLGVEELIPIQLKLNARKKALEKAKAIMEFKGRSGLNNKDSNTEEGKLEFEKFFEQYWSNYDFEATKDQKEVCRDIWNDFLSGKPMYRLLQGDVGSGKTAVAAFAAFLVTTLGYHAAIMAPTNILAVQHFEQLKKIFPNCKLITSGKSEESISSGDSVNSSGNNDTTSSRTESAQPTLFIGTQALLFRLEKLLDSKELEKENQKQEGQKINAKLGLIVVDEEHRFGVKQREQLANLINIESTSKKNKQLPHFLTMTATPIPRTLALSIFGNIELSVINTKPKMQKPKKTFIVPEFKRNDSYEWIKKLINNGEQVFWVCPLIEERKNVDGQEVLYGMDEKKSVEKHYKMLKENFSEFVIAKLHGKLANVEKTKIINQFKAGKTKILVATTVIEVGVDIPNANIIVIENAESYGLAQLHQLRGRVGRGERQGYCLINSSSQERLQYFAKTDNGLQLAEYDLKSRGPGEVYGNQQSGIPNLTIAEITNQKQISLAHELSVRIQNNLDNSKTEVEESLLWT